MNSSPNINSNKQSINVKSAEAAINADEDLGGLLQLVNHCSKSRQGSEDGSNKSCSNGSMISGRNRSSSELLASSFN